MKVKFHVVKSFFGAWVEHDGKVRFITEDGEIFTWKTKGAAEKALRKHWAHPKVFGVKGTFVKPTK